MDRVGVFYTLDALLAAALLATGVLLIGQLSPALVVDEQAQLQSQDIMRALNVIELGELNDSAAYLSGSNLSSSDSVLYAMSYFWVDGDPRAEQLANQIQSVVPSTHNASLRVENTYLFGQQPTNARHVSVSYQQVTGIDQGAPFAGVSSSASLQRIKEKYTSYYAYFGGFFGQGNITQQLALPADVSESRVEEFVLELDTPQNFSVFVNQAYCGNFTALSPPLTSERYNLTCASELQPGTNNVSVTYSDLGQAYVSGGFFQVRLRTDEFTAPAATTTTRYDFPIIQGVANLYDGIIIPETVQSFSARLRYDTQQDDVLTYFTVGEKTVYESNATGSQDVVLDDQDFLDAGLDYEQLSNQTVPIRFASFNATKQVVAEQANADIILVTDYSGSMEYRLYDDQQGDIGDFSDCDDTVYSNSDIRRSDLARCLNKEAVNILLNYSGNHVIPVHFYNTNIYHYLSDPGDEEAILSYYETPTSSFPQDPNGGTPLASSLSRAYELFSSYTDPEREKVVIFMTDGLASHCARDDDLPGGYWQFLYYEYNNPSCDNRNDVVHPTYECTGAATPSSCGSSSACQPALDNTQIVAQMLKDDFNATIHSVAFGPLDDCDSARIMLEQVANLSGGTYQTASDISGLLDVYQNISYTIVDQLELQSQELLIPQNITNSDLESGSYIEVTHDLKTPPLVTNQVSVTRSTPQFGCSISFSFPLQATILDANIVSYSGPHWTDEVVVNGEVIHLLSDYFVEYQRLGDPYRINVPRETLGVNNTITLRTGDSPTNQTGCSQNNSVIYTASVPAATARTGVYPSGEGCEWTYELEDGSNRTIAVPSDYSGSQTCSYTSALISYDQQDSAQLATYDLLSSLDFSGDGRLFVSFDAEDLEISLNQVADVPFLWGPVLVQLEVWR